MRGLMTDRPLLVSSLLEHAALVFGSVEIVTRSVEGPIHRYTWTDARRRSKQLAQALAALQLREGDAVATIAWNTHRHLELYYGVSGLGALVHTVNPRLHASQLVYVLNHAQDRALFVDLTFLPLVEAVLEKLESIRHVVVMTDRAHMPECRIPGVLCYEELLAAQDGSYEWPSFDENTAAGICYTSGTTGHPKGVVYSHRSSVLHAYGVALPGGIPAGRGDALLAVVPMFHVNAWGIPYGAAMCGYKLVMPGPRLDGAGLTELMNAERVTTYCGVPTVHLGLSRTGRRRGARPVPPHGDDRRRRAHVGADRGLPSLGIGFVHGWGMTETSPVGTISRITAAEEPLDDAAQVAFSCGRDARSSASSCGWWTRRAACSRTTGARPASCRCGVPGSRRPTWAMRPAARSSRATGSRPATWP